MGSCSHQPLPARASWSVQRGSGVGGVCWGKGGQEPCCCVCSGQRDTFPPESWFSLLTSRVGVNQQFSNLRRVSSYRARGCGVQGRLRPCHGLRLYPPRPSPVQASQQAYSRRLWVFLEEARSSFHSLMLGCRGDSPVPCCPFTSLNPGQTDRPRLRGTPPHL